jgi:hypothetical protein
MPGAEAAARLDLAEAEHCHSPTEREHPTRPRLRLLQRLLIMHIKMPALMKFIILSLWLCYVYEQHTGRGLTAIFLIRLASCCSTGIASESAL